MKRLVLTLAAAASISTVFAQRSNVESAAIYLRNSELSDAKNMIDQALVHEETKNDPKMWFYRTAIYDTIVHSKEYTNLIDENSVEQFIISARGCMETDTKKRYEYYCGNIAIINASFDAYNEAIKYAQNQKYDKAIKFYEYVLDNIKWDKDGVLKKNNLSDKNVHLAIADAAYKSKNAPAAKVHLQKLMDMDYNDHLIYSFMSQIYLEEGDTTKGLEFIEKGRKRFPAEKDLINQELNIYLIQGKTDILLNKVTEALNNEPENGTLVYIRGNIYDRFADDSRKKSEAAREEADKLSKKAKNEKVPANKTKIEAQAKAKRSAADSLDKQMKSYIANAEANYTKAIELMPENIDGYYAMGALLNNYENTELVNKMNSLNAPTQAEYDKKYAVLKKQQEELLSRSLKYFNDALAILDNMSTSTPEKKQYQKESKLMVLESIKSLYANLGNEAKFMEYKKMIEDLSNE